MYARVSSTYPQTYLTLSAGTCKGTDTSGSVADRRIRVLTAKLRKAQHLRDRVSIINLQSALRKADR